MAGLFKKVVISSYVSSAIVVPVFTAPAQHSAPEAIFAAWGYAVQIYCDFSGYTDIAIGLALLLGIRFPDQLRRALHGTRPAGLLAPLAHHAVALVARLPLHPARREQRVGGQDGPQHHDHHGAGRPVARRGVDVRVLGGAARGRPRGGAPAPPPAGAAGIAARGRRAGAHMAATLLDVPVRLSGLGVLQRQRTVPSLRRAGARDFGLGARRRRWSPRCWCSS